MDGIWLGLTAPPLLAFEQRHWLHQDVAPDFLTLQRAAHAEGIDLQLVSSYRDFHRQVAIWNRKWQGQTTLFDRAGQPLVFETLNEQEKLHAILTWSALPGTSRHHWGTDIDVYDKRAVEKWGQPFELVDAEYRAEGPCADLANWLSENAESLGFYRPFLADNGGVAREKWHLSHIATSETFEQERALPALIDALDGADILGKPIILDNIEMIYHRYALNQGNL